ncbi:MAG: hypothetical protein KF678_02135 [Phycisphaeraceae bacterium]|nr:hypothetical protein [Phycisphaeraceae bacterium]
MNRSRLNALAMMLAAGGLSSMASAQVLYSNGPLITAPPGACIPSGQFSSTLQGANTLLGTSMNGASFRVADDFTVPAGGWTVSGFNFYGYQTGATAGPSTFTGMTVQIWNGPPNAGGVVIAGDTTTNVMTSSNFDLTYRHGACGLTRPIFKNTVTLTAPVNLAPGTYWVEFGASGTIASGPWCPVTTYVGNPSPGGNALQFAVAGGTWTPVTDAGGGGTQDVPFEVLSSVGLQGACCFGAPSYTCAVTTQANCLSQNGTYLGNNSQCSSCPPPPLGACCLPFGGCTFVTQPACLGLNGTYSGDNVSCASANCPVSGRCCFSNGSCLVMTQTQCTSAGGTYGGNNTTCSQAACTQTPGNILCNGPVITSPTGTCLQPGEFSSQLPTGNGTLGYNFNGGANFRVADNFTVPSGATWTISGFTFYGYQTGAGTPVTSFTGATCQIWNGPPNVAGSTVVAGDAATNVLTDSTFSNVYRHAAACDFTRPMYTNKVTLASPVALTAGTYWVDFNATGSLASGPWLVPVTVTGLRGAPGADALQFTGAAWQALVDGTFPQDAPFCIQGTVSAGGGCYANCDGSTGTPLLTANDFQCFLNKYAGNDTYANCDGSTGNPLLTANDFQCFLNKYAGGCT